MAAVHLEVEKKYAADDAFELPSLADLVRGGDDQRSATDVLIPLAEGESVRQRLTATYFDTEDLRLAAAALTLRRRTGGGEGRRALEGPARAPPPSGGGPAAGRRPPPRARGPPQA